MLLQFECQRGTREDYSICLGRMELFREELPLPTLGKTNRYDWSMRPFSRSRVPPNFRLECLPLTCRVEYMLGIMVLISTV